MWRVSFKFIMDSGKIPAYTRYFPDDSENDLSVHMYARTASLGGRGFYASFDENIGKASEKSFCNYLDNFYMGPEPLTGNWYAVMDSVNRWMIPCEYSLPALLKEINEGICKCLRTHNWGWKEEACKKYAPQFEIVWDKDEYRIHFKDKGNLKAEDYHLVKDAKAFTFAVMPRLALTFIRSGFKAIYYGRCGLGHVEPHMAYGAWIGRFNQYRMYEFLPKEKYFREFMNSSKAVSWGTGVTILSWIDEDSPPLTRKLIKTLCKKHSKVTEVISELVEKHLFKNILGRVLEDVRCEWKPSKQNPAILMAVLTFKFKGKFSRLELSFAKEFAELLQWNTDPIAFYKGKYRFAVERATRDNPIVVYDSTGEKPPTRGLRVQTTARNTGIFNWNLDSSTGIPTIVAVEPTLPDFGLRHLQINNLRDDKRSHYFNTLEKNACLGDERLLYCSNPKVSFLLQSEGGRKVFDLNKASLVLDARVMFSNGLSLRSENTIDIKQEANMERCFHLFSNFFERITIKTEGEEEEEEKKSPIVLYNLSGTKFRASVQRILRRVFGGGQDLPPILKQLKKQMKMYNLDKSYLNRLVIPLFCFTELPQESLLSAHNIRIDLTLAHPSNWVKPLWTNQKPMFYLRIENNYLYCPTVEVEKREWSAFNNLLTRNHRIRYDNPRFDFRSVDLAPIDNQGWRHGAKIADKLEKEIDYYIVAINTDRDTLPDCDYDKGDFYSVGLTGVDTTDASLIPKTWIYTLGGGSECTEAQKVIENVLHFNFRLLCASLKQQQSSNMYCPSVGDGAERFAKDSILLLTFKAPVGEVDTKPAPLELSIKLNKSSKSPLKATIVRVFKYNYKIAKNSKKIVLY